jgi:hypothetical protein
VIDVPLIDRLIYWVRERERMRTRRERGEPPPWSDDALLRSYRFTNVNVQNDRVSRTIFDKVAQPYADHPGLIVGLTVCRFTNDPDVIEAVCDSLVPFDADRFLAIMTERAARGQSLERRAYVIPGGVKGEIKAINLTRALFVPLAAAVESVRPKPGDTVAAVFERLRRFKYLDAGFITAQIARDLKQAAPLRDASDWMTFVRSGPGSQRCANRLLGMSRKADIEWRRPEDDWRELFNQIVDLAAPRVAAEGIVLDRQSWQSCFCETDKYLRFQAAICAGRGSTSMTARRPARAPTKWRSCNDDRVAPADRTGALRFRRLSRGAGAALPGIGRPGAESAPSFAQAVDLRRSRHRAAYGDGSPPRC